MRPASPLLGARALHVYDYCLRSLTVHGDVAECGVAGGETSAELVKIVEECAEGKRVHLFDTFEGLPDIATSEELAHAEGTMLRKGNFAVPENIVRSRLDYRVAYTIHKGRFADTFGAFQNPLCFIHADADLYHSTVEILRLSDRCLVSGGVIIFDDHNNPAAPGVTLALERHLEPSSYDIIDRRETMQFIAIKR